MKNHDIVDLQTYKKLNLIKEKIKEDDQIKKQEDNPILKLQLIKMIDKEINEVEVLQDSARFEIDIKLISYCEGNLTAFNTIKAYLLNNENILGTLKDIIFRRIPELIESQKEQKDFSNGHFTMGYLSALRTMESKIKKILATNTK